MENACRRRGPLSHTTGDSDLDLEFDPYSPSTIITGLDPTRLHNINTSMHWLQDNRLRHIALAITSSSNNNTDSNHIPTTETDTTTILKAASKNGPIAVRTAVAELITSKFSSLLSIPIEKLSSPGALDRPLTDFGIDSMIAAEVRGWVWRTFGVELKLSMLVGVSGTIGDLAEGVCGGLRLDLEVDANENGP